MKLLIGLGNPGKKYGATRHNVGFTAVDIVAERIGTAIAKEKFSSLFGIGKISETDVCIVKPQTFMNLSGEAVASFARFYKVSGEDILVVHDDLDMEPGKLKLAFRSGSGGHNGVESVIAQLGTNEFWRLKIGIGKPLDERDPADYVLEKFSSGEKKAFDKILKASSDAVTDFFAIGPEKTMQKYHGTLVL